MSKRAHESAFALSAPDGLLVTARSGFDAPQPQVQLSPPSSPSALYVPGRWPLEHDSVIESPKFAGPSVAPAGSSFLYTLSKWAVTTSIATLTALGARFAQRFLRRQQIIVQPIVREDGARKKRIIDAGPADLPSTPKPPRRRRVGRGRNTFAPVAPSIPSPSPSPQPPVPQSPPAVQDAANDSDVDMVDVHDMDDTDDSLDWSWSQVDSSSTPPLGRVPSPFQDTPLRSPFQDTPLRSPFQDTLLRSPFPETPLRSPLQETPLSSPLNEAPPSSPFDEAPPSSPFDEAPPSSPFDEAPPSSPFDEAPPSSPFDEAPPLSPFVQARPSSPFVQAPLTLPSEPQDEFSSFLSERRLMLISPKSHKKIIIGAPIPPARKLLVNIQLNRVGAKFPRDEPTAANHTVPAPSPVVSQEPSALQRITMQLNMLRTNAPLVAQRAQQASEQYRAQAEARQNSFADVPTEDRFNHVPTVNEELSFLSDAPDEDIEDAIDAPEEDVEDAIDEAAITLYSPVPETPKPRHVRWSSHANAKPFFIDARITEAMDSTLETIIFSPVRPSELIEDASDDGDQESSDSSPSRSNGSPSHIASTVSGGFTGVPASTWEDSEDSLEESQISIELLDDLHQQLHQKLDLAPSQSPTPPPAVKALVAPLSSEERDVLDAIVAKTAHGQKPDQEIIQYKLNVRDLSTLLPAQFNGDPKAWLNDNIVNEYLTILTSHENTAAGFVLEKDGAPPPVHAFSSFWYSTLKRDSKRVKRWAARVNLDGAKYLECGLVLYPICDMGHWRLLVVRPQERTIEYLDSLDWSSEEIIVKFKEYLKEELGPAWDPNEWTVLSKQRSTHQDNTSDCGVFTLLNALVVLRGEDFKKVLCCDGMAEARERIAITLLAREPTTEFD